MLRDKVYRWPDWDRESDENHLMWCVAEMARTDPTDSAWIESRAHHISVLSQYLNGTVPYQWQGPGRGFAGVEL